MPDFFFEYRRLLLVISPGDPSQKVEAMIYQPSKMVEKYINPEK